MNGLTNRKSEDGFSKCSAQTLDPNISINWGRGKLREEKKSSHVCANIFDKLSVCDPVIV